MERGGWVTTKNINNIEDTYVHTYATNRKSNLPIVSAEFNFIISPLQCSQMRFLWQFVYSLEHGGGGGGGRDCVCV